MSPGVRNKVGRAALVPLAVALAGGVVLLLYHLAGESLWLDEAMSAWVATLPTDRFLAFFRELPEQHPLYYLLLRAWTVLGTSEFLLRLPSVVFALAGIVAIRSLAREVAGERVAGIAALLLAFSPFWIYYGREARMYTLLAFLVMVHSLFFLVWMRRGDAGPLLGYVLSGILGAYCHFFFLFVPVAHLAFYLIVLRDAARPRTRSLLFSLALIYLAYVPWAIMILLYRPEAQSWKGGLHLLLGLPYTFFRFSVGYSLLTLNAGWEDRIWNLIGSDGPLILLALVVYGGLAAAGLRSARRDRTAFWFLCSGLLVPLALTMLLSLTFTVLVGERYLIVAFPFYVILIAMGIEHILQRNAWRRSAAPLAGLALVAVLGVAFGRMYFSDSFGKEQWRDAVSYIRARQEPGDVVLFQKDFIEGPFRYYWNRGLSGQELPSGNGMPPAELLARDRIWLVQAHVFDGAELDRCESFLRRTHEPQAFRFFPKEGGIAVRLFTARKPHPASGFGSDSPHDQPGSPCS